MSSHWMSSTFTLPVFRYTQSPNVSTSVLNSQQIIPDVTHNGQRLSDLPRSYPQCVYARGPVISRHLSSILRYKDGFIVSAHASLYSHSPCNIANTIIELIFDLSSFRIESRREATSHYEELRTRTYHNPEDPDVLLRYLLLFDKIYFFGTLEKLCYIEVVQKLDEAYGITTGHQVKVNGLSSFQFPYECRISILDLSNHPEWSDPRRRLHFYLGVVLHEALHAVFALYVCLCSGECRLREENYLGPKGHRKAWEEAATAIENDTASLYGGRLDLHILSSVNYDSAPSENERIDVGQDGNYDSDDNDEQEYHYDEEFHFEGDYSYEEKFSDDQEDSEDKTHDGF